MFKSYIYRELRHLIIKPFAENKMRKEFSRIAFLLTMGIAVAAANDGGSTLNLSASELAEGLEAGRQFVKDMEEIEAKIDLLNEEYSQNMYARFKPFIPEAVKQSKEAAKKLYALRYLSDRLEIPADKISVDEQPVGKMIERQLPLPVLETCNTSYPYRTFDGSCNNLNSPRFGQANTIFQRLLGASYSDGISQIRKSISGGPLPSPRLISTTVVINESLPTYEATLLTMQYGQFLDHDLTLTPTHKTSTGGSITCCNGGSQTGTTPASALHPECMSIPIPSNDPIYGNVNCMNLVRSTFGLQLDGTTPPNREQINANTHWVDASQIYGSSNVVAQSLRDPSAGKGLMKVSIQGGRTLLPVANTCCPGDPTNSCAAAKSCFVAGDFRVAEQPLLTILHTLWVREHNRVANRLYGKYGSSKSDEFYYQEARRIVIAEFQHITYEEYLPVLIGPQLAHKCQQSSISTTGPSNPAVFTEFSTAAYRLGHSQLRSFIRLYEADGTRSDQSYFLSDSFFDGARLLYPTFMDNALRGLTQTPVQTVDQCFADDITSQLFKPPASKLGMDLVSLNLQRGRDHGLVSYSNAWIAGQKNVLNAQALLENFDNLRSTTPQDVINSFKKVYLTVNDVDLFMGGVTEIPLPGALVGPTFGYIISQQFENLRRSDRFFYTDLTKSVSFSSSQLNEIKKVSLARIICDNSDGTITNIQQNVFLSPSGANAPVPCSSIPGIDFNSFFNTQSPSPPTRPPPPPPSSRPPPPPHGPRPPPHGPRPPPPGRK